VGLTDSVELRRLRGFEQHGATLLSRNAAHVVGDCPFCDHPSHFYVNIKTLLWDCKHCLKAGDFARFLDLCSERYRTALTDALAATLAKDRGITPKTLRSWGVGWADIFYTIPLSGNSRRLTTGLQRYYLSEHRLLETTGGKLSFIVPEMVYGSDTLWVCEGAWDGMALWEALEALNLREDVVASPGAGTFPGDLERFYGKDVVFVYDNDTAGIVGSKRAAAKVSNVARSVKFMQWPRGIPEGYDIRDLYKAYQRDAKRVYHDIRKALVDQPPQSASEIAADAPVVSELPTLSGSGMGAEEALENYRRWLEMPADGEYLDVLFGTCFGNRLPDDPLWMFLVAAPGGMKSELLMSIAMAPRIRTMTSLTPHALISGSIGPQGSDPSLIPQLNGRVLSIKDFTAILSLNSIARDEIFATLRDAYDGQTEKSYGTGVVRRYNSRFGIIAGVTPAIETLSSANQSLGERFLKYRLRGGWTTTSSQEAIRRALQNLADSVRMRSELSETGKAVLDRDVTPSDAPTVTPDVIEKITQLAQWVAMLRGVVYRERYTQTVQYKPTIEVGTRLAKQLCKLAFGISIFHRESVVTERTYLTLAHVAQDTVPDRVEEVIRHLYTHFDDGYTSTATLASKSRLPDETVRYLLQDLTLLRVVIKEKGRLSGWALAPRVHRLMTSLKLYREALGWAGVAKKKQPATRRLTRRAPNV